MPDYEHSEITDTIIRSALQVHNALGYGFLEKVYENAIVLEVRKQGLAANQQQPISVFYDGQILEEYFADLVVADCVIVEIKAVKSLEQIHEVQLVNYLKATSLRVGLLLNFGTSLDAKRRVFSPEKTGRLGLASHRDSPPSPGVSNQR
jgi:GxxExxY protein